ncbi:MAG: transporter [bacterium]
MYPRAGSLPAVGRLTRTALAASLLLLLGTHPAAAQPDGIPMDGEAIYMMSCANCHGADGKGVSQGQLGFTLPVPDLTDCDFANREPDGDWMAVAHAGGPVRGFSPLMPAFEGVLTVEQLQLAVDHIRTLCQNDDWPRGDLNLPRALVTEKAFPEDEAVFTAITPSEEITSVTGEFVYEQRFGARNQFELVIPFGWREMAVTGGAPDETNWASAMGDIAVGVKRAMYHNFGSGTIFSLTGEIILPTGDEEEGFGKGTAVFEPFFSFGQILPAGFFMHSQGGVELPFDETKSAQEGFLRFVLGRTFTVGQWGRTFAPMVELLGGQELEGGAEPSWDIAPQLFFTLNRRQHILMNIGVRTPMDDAFGPDTQVMAYILLDWFDGSFWEGW